MLNLDQRISQLENSAAKLAENKTNLRNFYVKARKDISQIMSAEIAMIRSREEQLIDELLRVHDRIESRITEKQNIVQHAIGACQNARESCRDVPMFVESAVVDDDDDVRIEFNADVMASRDHIASFGRITHANKCRRAEPLAVGSTLPKQFEVYEDDDDNWLLSKKSCGAPASVPESPLEVNAVKGWLSRLPSNNAALDMDVTQFAFDGEPTEESDFSETTSSYEVVPDQRSVLSSNRTITAPQSEKSFLISRRFIENIDIPMKEWLLNVSESCKTGNIESNDGFCQETVSTSDDYKFKKTIRNVQESQNDQWIHTSTSGCSNNDSMEAMQESTSATVVANESNFNEEQFIDHLSKLFNSGFSSLTRKNTCPKDDDIHRWRMIMKQMHGDEGYEAWLQH